MTVQNAIVWADIPVNDMDRAKRFYGAVLGVEIMDMPGAGGDIALIPPLGGEPGEQGMVVSADLTTSLTPCADGVTVYLNTLGDLAGMLARVEPAGGKVLQEPRDMGPMVGTIAFILDSEGNRIGLQQPSPRK